MKTYHILNYIDNPEGIMDLYYYLDVASITEWITNDHITIENLNYNIHIPSYVISEWEDGVERILVMEKEDLDNILNDKEEYDEEYDEEYLTFVKDYRHHFTFKKDNI